MNFSEALVELKNGKKIRRPSFGETAYLIACYHMLPDLEEINKHPEKYLNLSGWRGSHLLPQINAGMSIAKMEGDCLERRNGDISDRMIPIPDIMADDWEIVK